MCIICYITLFILALVLGNVFSSFCGQNKMRSMMRHDMYAGWRFGELKWDSMHQVGLAITMLYVHLISLANQPHILRLFTVPSSLFFPPEPSPESARLIKTGWDYYQASYPASNNGMWSGGGSTSFTGFISLPPSCPPGPRPRLPLRPITPFLHQQ